MMLVNSRQLEAAAATVRKRRRPQMIHAEGVAVNAAQCEAAARILREAEPCVANGDVSERPGFIDRNDQGDPAVLVFRMGILPSYRYEIDRSGAIASDDEDGPER